MNVTVIPRLVVRDADAAIDFYRRALRALPGTRHTSPDGAVVHAEIQVGATLLTLKEEDHVDRSPLSIGGTSVLLMLDVPDADAAGDALLAAGASRSSRSGTCRTASARAASPIRSAISGW